MPYDDDEFDDQISDREYDYEKRYNYDEDDYEFDDGTSDDDYYEME